MYIDERIPTSMVKKIGLLICSGFFAAVILGSLASIAGTPALPVVQASERLTFWNRPLSSTELAQLKQPRPKTSLSEIETLLNLNKKAPRLKKLSGDATNTKHLPGESDQIKAIAREAAGRYQLDPRLIRAVISVESRFDSRAVSYKGASGLMQLIPSTASELGVDDVFNPHQNILAGAQYLRILSDEFNSLESVLSAYNAGPQRVRDGSVPVETREYVERVIGVYQGLVNS